MLGLLSEAPQLDETRSRRRQGSMHLLRRGRAAVPAVSSVPARRCFRSAGPRQERSGLRAVVARLVLLNTDAEVAAGFRKPLRKQHSRWRASQRPAVVVLSQDPARRVRPAAPVSSPSRCPPSITSRRAGGESRVSWVADESALHPYSQGYPRGQRHAGCSCPTAVAVCELKPGRDRDRSAPGRSRCSARNAVTRSTWSGEAGTAVV